MDYIDTLIIKHRDSGIIVDTNLLILYIIGAYNIEYVEKFKRIKNKGYTKDDFEALVRILKTFNKVFLTPHVLAELSNLTFSYKKEDKDFTEYLSCTIALLKDIEERHIAKNTILASNFFKFGFADVSIIELAISNNLVVITDDLPLFGLLNNQGIDSINMTHVRVYK